MHGGGLSALTLYVNGYIKSPPNSVHIRCHATVRHASLIYLLVILTTLLDLIRVSDTGLTSVLSPNIQSAPATGSVLFSSFEKSSNVLEVLSKVASLVY
ncbi:hypothetical protein BDR06DRAFT_486706 [Suillus hirtellus]|nr:hypothetical protein BDR06DRAFT_486706 [Suillus hirtellus]